jgi:hypothetical protein
MKIPAVLHVNVHVHLGSTQGHQDANQTSLLQSRFTQSSSAPTCTSVQGIASGVQQCRQFAITVQIGTLDASFGVGMVL